MYYSHGIRSSDSGQQPGTGMALSPVESSSLDDGTGEFPLSKDSKESRRFFFANDPEVCPALKEFACSCGE